MSNQKLQIPHFEKYAIFQTGGKQYQALEGKTLAVEKLKLEPGQEIIFDQVLLRKLNENDLEIGQPFLNTHITATLVKHMRGPKLVIFKFKRRKKSRRKQGHRQDLSVVRFVTV